MRRFNINAGDIIYAYKDTVPVFAGKIGSEEYQPFTDDINGGIDFLNRANEASFSSLNKYLGDATTSTKRNIRVQFDFGSQIGNYSGQFYEGDSEKYYKVQVLLIATYGGGSEAGMNGYGWVRESDITNVEKELDAAVEAGNVTSTKVDLAKARADDAKAAVESTTKKDDSTDLGKKAVIDGNQSLDASKTNWLLIGGIFVGVVALGGGLLYAFRTPKTP